MKKIQQNKDPHDLPLDLAGVGGLVHGGGGGGEPPELAAGGRGLQGVQLEERKCKTKQGKNAMKATENTRCQDKRNDIQTQELRHQDVMQAKKIT